MTRRNKPKQPKRYCVVGQVPISVKHLAKAAQQLAFARDRLVTVSHVTGSRPDTEAFPDEFVKGWEAAMAVVQRAVSGQLTTSLSPETPQTEEVPEYVKSAISEE